MIRADVVVVGAGLSGLAAAAMLADAGRDVTVVARGNGFTHWGAGAVDVLGVAGGRDVAAPADAIPALPATHPYRLAGGLPALRAGLDDLTKVAEDAGLRYAGSPDANRGQVTALGTWRTTCLVPQTAAQPLAGRIAVIGLEGFRDFSAELCAQSLRRAGLDASAATVPLPPWSHERHATAVELARAFDQRNFRDRVAEAVGRAAAGADVCVLPAVLGVRDGQVGWAELQARAGLPVVEAAIPPPSIPGLRLYDAYRAKLERLGVRWLFGFPAVGVDRDGGRVTAVRADGAARQITIRCHEVVLATGAVAGGGVRAHRDGTLTEVVAGLPVAGLGSRTGYVADDFLAAHPLGAAGVAADAELRPLTGTGERVALDGVRCTGTLLAGCDPTAEGCREGVAVATAARLAELLAPTPSAVT